MTDAKAVAATPVRVAKVIDEYRIVINKGRSTGIREGTRFLIYGLGDEIVDPDTNQSLGRLELVRGIAAVIHLQENIATLESAKTRKPAPTVRTIKKGRNALSGLALFAGAGDETIEERQGEPTTVPFEDVVPGDFARPL